ncbi:MAG: glycoside hydrolase family 3 N-terminal domain-containing protein, partial [Bacteroidota bacterium]
MRTSIRVFFLILVFFIISSFVIPNKKAPLETVSAPPFMGYKSQWVDSVMNTLTLDEKIGQLMMVPVYPSNNLVHVADVSKLIETYKVGGLIFFQGGPVKQASLTNYLQKKAKIPLLVSIDGEWGLSMRVDSTMR